MVAQRIDLVCQLLILGLHFGLRPGLLLDVIRQLKLLLRVEFTQILALLVLENAQEVA